LREVISTGFDKSLKAAKTAGASKLFGKIKDTFKNKKKEEEAANDIVKGLLEEFTQSYEL
jgi:hypothetical protein